MTEQDAASVEYDHGARDLALEILCSAVATHPDNHIGVTLSVAGSIVTGDLVGPRTWWNQLTAAYPEAGYITDISKGFLKSLGEGDDMPDGWVPDIVHLTNARYLTGNQVIPSGSPYMFWRGQITEVDGWSFGALKAD